MTQKIIKAKSPTRGRTAHSKGLAEKVKLVERGVPRVKLPDFKAGDTIRVHVRIVEGEKERVQAYEGIAIRRDNRAFGKTFTVRKISHGVGVERIFLETSPKLAKVELVQSSKTRRAKLYYIRGRAGKAAKLDQEFLTSSSESAPKA